MRVTGAEGKAGTLAIAVNVPGQVLVSPSSLSFSNTGTSDSQSVTVTQTGNSAAFKADASSCRSKGVATVQAGSYAGGSQSFQVTPTAVGSCLVTFTGSGGQQGTLAITVLPRTRVGPFSFTYSYGAGGELQEEQFVMAADAQVGTTSMSYAYTPAGRLLQHSETAPGGAAMVSKDTYDGYGRLQNQNFPDGNGLGQMEYDPAGELLGQVMSMSKGGPYTQTWTYDSLGELVASDPGTAGLYGASVSYYADGVQVFSTSRALRMTGAPSGISATWDARMGAAISSSYEYGEVVGKNTTSLVTAQTAASYDAVGRSLASTSQSVTMNSPTSIPSGSTVTRTYDVENHLVSADGVGFPKAPPAGDTPVPHSIYTTYAWGVNGHPIRIGTGPDNATGTTGFDTLIWDGGAPLYTMRHGASADTLDDVKLGAAGELTPTDPGYSGLTFYDRGHDGGVLFAHNVTGAQLLEAGNPWAIPLTVCASWPVPSAGSSVPLNVQWTAYNGAMCPGPAVPTIGNGATIGMLRTDGISDGVSTIQGTRAYDPTTSQWTTPDAYAGSVDDPGSQKSYMWNGNNPVAYADPNGYETIELFDNKFFAGVGHAAIFITSGKSDSGTLYCWCGSRGPNPASGPPRKIIERTNLRSLTRGVGKGSAARYDTGIVFNTNHKQEATESSLFRKDNSNYNVIDHNCVEECSAALHAAAVISGAQQRNAIPGLDEARAGVSLQKIDSSLTESKPTEPR